MRAKLAGVCLFGVALALATGVPAQAQTGTAITDIRQESSDRSTRLVVESTGPLAYTYYSPDPLTLVVDIPEVDASQVPARVNVGTREVESIRVTTLARADGRNLARVEVRLASLVPYQIFSKDKSLNLVFERPASLAGAEPAAAVAPVASQAPVATAPATPLAFVPVAPVPAATTSEPPNGPRATRISAVTRDQIGSLLAFTVKADGRLKYRDFLLQNPERLVIDFADVTARTAMRSLEVGETPVRKVRLGQFSAESPKVARLVVDLSERSPYRIIDGTDGVRIVFGETSEAASPAHAPLAALQKPRARARRLVAPGRSRSVAAALDRAARDAGPARAPGGRPGAGARRCRRAPSRETSARPAGRPATSARRSAWISRTVTCRTSSASSPTSRASTWSSTLE